MFSVFLTWLFAAIGSFLAKKSVTISIWIGLLVVGVGCGLGFWFSTSTFAKVLLGVLILDEALVYAALEDWIPGLSLWVEPTPAPTPSPTPAPKPKKS